jgi:D-arabinitol dehydrogenase (NADP+)
MSDAQAAFVEPVSRVVCALGRLRVNPGDEALVFGAGPMGVLLVQALLHSGSSRVVVVGKEPGRRGLAENMGAAALASDPGPADQLRAAAPYEIFPRDISIIGSFAPCHTFPPAIDWLANRIVDVAPLVSHTLPLAEFTRGFQEFAAGRTLKVHLRPGA